MKARPWIDLVLGVLILSMALPAPAFAQGGFDPSVQSPELMMDEARTVYLGNLARRDHGLPPLRWNQQLTYAARWYSWDSVENRAPGFCGHQDTHGHWPDYRARAFGYQGIAGAENAFCGYVTPEFAIQGWLDSPGHRANLLNPDSREIGLGYYRRSDGRGYVTQDFGQDPAYAPVIIKNEAISTATPDVRLYVYDHQSDGGFAGQAPATAMMVSNDACFTGASWRPYAPELSWRLESGKGWRTVYVKTRDAFHRTMTASDAIYLGGDPSPEELLAAPLSTTQPQVTVYPPGYADLPKMQFSLGWMADDSMETFEKWWGNGERVDDPDAWGGTAFRLRPGDGESFAWVWDTRFFPNVPMTAYFRLKVSNNSSHREVARIAVKGGGVEYGPVKLRGVDFDAPNAYQEFPIDFTFKPDEDNAFLTFEFWRSGSADVYVDVVAIFDAPRPAQSPFTWRVPGGNYRGQGVWVRYTDGNRFSPILEAPTRPATLQASPASVSFLASRERVTPKSQTISIHQACSTAPWQIATNAPWLHAQRQGDSVRVWVDASGLNPGRYTGAITISATDAPSASVRVDLLVAEQLRSVYHPLLLK